jgi:hypothetical protein
MAKPRDKCARAAAGQAVAFDLAPGLGRRDMLRRTGVVVPGIGAAVPCICRGLKLCLIAFFAFLAAAPALAQASREYEVKAVFLWRLTQFTQWPADAFEDSESPIVICVLAEEPLVNALELAVRGESSHGRRLAVQQQRRWDSGRMCHVLFIGTSFARQNREILAAVRGKSILTVSDIEGFTRASDGMIQFLIDQNRIKLRINLKPVAAARLVLDPRLLRTAEIVEN